MMNNNRKEKKCKYCGDKATSKGYCSKHYSFLYNRKLHNSDFEICKKALDEYYNRNKICLFCGKNAYGQGYCVRHYATLKRLKIDIKDRNKCFETLTQYEEKCKERELNREERIAKAKQLELQKQLERRTKKVSNTCYVCGNKHYGKGLCNKHYHIIRRTDIDMNNRNEVINYLNNKIKDRRVRQDE